MRAVASSSPSARRYPDEHRVVLSSVRPHPAHGAGVFVYADGASPDDAIAIRFRIARDDLERARLRRREETNLGTLRALERAGEGVFAREDGRAAVARRPYSTRELDRLLTRRGYGAEARAFALSAVSGAIDERRQAVAIAAARLRRRPSSERAIAAYLSERGYGREEVAAAIDALRESDPDCFRRAAERALAAMPDRDRVTREAARRRMAARGFRSGDLPPEIS